jgi:hypothetical protein
MSVNVSCPVSSRNNTAMKQSAHLRHCKAQPEAIRKVVYFRIASSLRSPPDYSPNRKNPRSGYPSRYCERGFTFRRTPFLAFCDKMSIAGNGNRAPGGKHNSFF